MDDLLYPIFDLLNLYSFAKIIVPEPCYTTFFRNYEFSDVVCLKILISKCLGYGIICGSVLVKVPQIMKIIKAKSGQGIDLNAVTLELVACMSTLCYGFNKGFPFSAYGEAIFMSFQTCFIGVLILLFAGKKSSSIVYMLSFIILLSFLMSSYANEGLLWILQALVIPNVVLARSLQILANYRNKTTGQLSAITITMVMLGSMARVFTSWVETKDMMVTLTFVISFITNAIIFFQVIYYWHRCEKGSNKKYCPVHKTEQKENLTNLEMKDNDKTESTVKKRNTSSVK